MKDLGRHLFTFAVISDSHVNEDDDRSVSPYACNQLANGRLRYVVHDLNRRQPAFTVHLGDMANPLPELPTFARAAERFKAIAGELRSPLHLVAGNHCLGDKPGGWVPVPRVSVKSIRQYVEIHGTATYSFDHGPCHFVVLSSLLINSGLAAEAAQKSWVEDDLAEADEAGQRIWVMMHYPAYIGAPDELGSYDNVDQPGRSWLLHLFEEHDVEAVCSGHVHNYFYNRYAGTDLYTVPATSFVRQDYGELFGVAPTDQEGGRNDPAKLGYCLVEVHEKGHVNRVVRTHGRVLGVCPSIRTTPSSDGLGQEVELQARVPGALAAGAPQNESEAAELIGAGAPQGHPVIVAPQGRVGVEMRENWLSRVALRTNNSVSPFTRRCARNDWAVLALQEMGVSRVRVSLQELALDDVVERMATLQEAGFEFTVYSYGIPREPEYRLIREHRAQLAGWELIMRPDQVHAVARRLAGGDLPCYLNEVRDVSQGQLDGANVKHEANYGFQLTERQRLEELARRSEVRDTFRGLVFRIWRKGQPRVAPWPAIREISAMGRAWDMHHQAHVLFSGNLTADRLEDDLSTANRVAEATLASWVAGNVDVTFDTFEDVDRGYFVRHGLVDRLYNPRLAARVLRHLQAALAQYDRGDVRDGLAEDSGYGRLLTVSFSTGRLVLVLPGEGFTSSNLAALCGGSQDLSRAEGARAESILDLEDGTVSELAARTTGLGPRPDEPVIVDKPVLVTTRGPLAVPRQE